MSAKNRTIIFIATILVPAVLLAADDPFVGSWKLNISKSTYNSGPPPKIPDVFIYEASPNGGLKVTVTGAAPHDRIETYDGKPHPVVSDPGADAVAVKRISPYVIQGENWKKGQIVTHLTRTVSKDRQTMTVKVKKTDAQGKVVEDTRVYEKQ